MRIFVALATAAALVAHAPSVQAFCPDARVPAAISAPTGAGAGCFKAIGKAASGMTKTKIKAHGKCLASLDHGQDCYQGKAAAKALKGGNKITGKLADACADDAAQAALSNTYGALTDENALASCAIGQVAVAADGYLGATHGISGTAGGGSAHEKCAATLQKEAGKLLPSLVKTIDKCIQGQVKAGNAGDLAAACLGEMIGAGGYTAGSDAKTADKVSGAIAKFNSKVDGVCSGDPGLIQISSIFACQGAETASDLQACVSCTSMSAVFDIFAAAYSEDGTYIANGAGALATAIGAAAPGEKLLIAGGDYPESVDVTGLDGLTMVGCGSATNDRPHLFPAARGPVAPNGIASSGTNDLTFQSLHVEGWADNGIRISTANGVTFRDILGDGGDSTPSDPGDPSTRCPNCSLYAVFPVESSNVLVETSEVFDIKDAAIYVGSSEDIIVRSNRVYDSVTGIEIENSERADTYHNVAYGNAGGILSFKLTGPVKQVHSDHLFEHNASFNNNTPNFGAPGSTVSAVPRGTGFMIISDANSTYRQNYIADNGSVGMLVLNQRAVFALTGDSSFDPPSTIQACSNLRFENNLMRNSGFDPDPLYDSLPGGAGNYIGHVFMALFQNDDDPGDGDGDPDNGNCWVGPAPPLPSGGLGAGVNPLGGVSYLTCP